MIEGMVAEVVGACSGGAVLTAWALWLGLPPAVVAALGALPACAQLVQLPAAQLTSRKGPRKVALWAVTASRQLLLPLAALPLLGLPARSAQLLLVAVAAVSAILGVVGNNAWTAWMGDLVPARIRGRYFGLRAAACTLGATLASVVVGLSLDAGRRSAATGAALAALSLTACICGALTTILLHRQHEPRAQRQRPLRTAEAIKPCLASGPRRLLAYQFAWSAAGGVAAGFYNVHALEALQLGFLRLALYNATLAAARMVAAPLWGRAVDSLGARPVLVVCSAGLAVPPLIWTVVGPGALWLLAIDAVVAGVLMAGQSIAAFSLPLACGAREERPFHLAAFGTAGGLATVLAALLGTAWVARHPDGFSLLGTQRVAFHALFLVSALGRLAACGLAMRIVEPGAQPASRLLARLLPARS